MKKLPALSLRRVPFLLGLSVGLGTAMLPGWASAQSTYEHKRVVPGLLVQSAPAPTPVAPPPADKVANLQLSSNSVNFEQVATHTAVSRQILATNLGDAPLQFTAAPSLSGSSAFSTLSTSCAQQLEPQQSCLTEIQARPTTGGAHSATLQFQSTLTSSPHEVALLMQAYNPLTLASSTLPVGALNTAYPAVSFASMVGVANEASPDWAQAVWSLTGGLPAGMSFNTSTGVLSGTPSALTSAEGTPLTVGVTYKQNQAQANYTLLVSGVAYSLAPLSAFPNTAAGFSSQQVLTLTNNGVSPVTVESLTVSTGSPTFTVSHTCATLAAGASCPVTVTFAPTSTGPKSGQLSVKFQGVAAFTHALSGTAGATTLAVSGTGYNFGTVSIGSSATHDLTVSNTGAYPSVVTLSGLTAPLTVQSTTCSGTLAAGSSCVATVKFTPSSPVSTAQTLAVAGSTGVTSRTTAYSGSGQRAMAVSASATELNLYTLYTSSYGTPSAAVNLQVTVNAGVVLRSNSVTAPALTTGAFPSGTVVTLINNGVIHGKGGKGANGGTATVAPVAGEDGGPALNLTVNTTIDNTQGYIFGGGGGGGASRYGTYSVGQTQGGSGGGGGAGGGAAGAAGSGYFWGNAGTIGTTGQTGAPGTGGASTSVTYAGAAGGAYGAAGATATLGSAGGAAGAAIVKNGRTVSWVGGNVAARVKGTVQ